MKKTIAFTLVLLELAQLSGGSLAALAAPPIDVADQVCVDPSQGEFAQQLRDYVAAYNADSHLRRTLLASRIKKSVFANPGSPDYIEKLRYLDRQAASSPDALYDLAKSLQLQWEARYGLGLGERQSLRVNGGEKIGASVAIIALGVAVLKNPVNAPKYFRVVRWLLPIAGAAAGATVAEGLNYTGWLDGHMPISPAHVMHLGIDENDFRMDDDTVMKTLASIGAGFAATELTYLILAARAARYVNLAATPAKINPIVLVASIVIGIAIEQGVEYAIDEHQYSKFLGRVTDARDLVDLGMNSGEDTQVYTGADALLKGSSDLASYLNKPLIEAITEFNSSVADAAKDTGVTDESKPTPEFTTKLNSLTADFSEKVRRILFDRGNGIDEDYRAITVLNYLLNHDEDQIDKMGDDGKERAQVYVDGFHRWKEADENRRQMNLGQKQYDELFHGYISGLLEAKSKQLAAEFRSGNIPRNANRVLLLAASFLRSTGREYVEDQMNALLSIIARNDMLVAGVTNGGSTQAFLEDSNTDPK
jgi:hypothetical protein